MPERQVSVKVLEVNQLQNNKKKSINWNKRESRQLDVQIFKLHASVLETNAKIRKSK